MMITDLSDDLVEEILSRVPATSLKRLRSACKQWNAFFKDERFAKKHFAKSAKQFEVLMLKEYRVYSLSVNELLNNVGAAPSIVVPHITSIEFKGLESIYISRVFHCDGLLLCTTNEYMLVVWNPCLGETRLIQPKTVYKKKTWFALGYQNTSSSSCRIYKILKYWNHNQNGRVVYEFEILGLSSDSWRVLDVDVVNPDQCIIHSNGVSLKGNTYWLAHKNNEGSHERVLLGFDFSTETFRRLCLPFQDFVRDTVALSVVREEELIVFHQRKDTLMLDIWVTTNFDQTKALSWIKFLAVDLYTQNCQLWRFVNFFIEEEKKVAMFIGKRDEWNIVCIIGKDGKYRELSLEESTNKSMMRPFAFNYVPSLLHIQQG